MIEKTIFLNSISAASALSVVLPSLSGVIIVSASVGLVLCIGLIISGINDKRKEMNKNDSA